MSGPVIVAVITTTGSLLGIVVTAIAAVRASRRAATSEKQALESQHALEQQRLDNERVKTLEARLDAAEQRSRADWMAYQDKHVQDALTKRKMGDHIDALEHHIYQQKPPPPPPRPEGI